MKNVLIFQISKLWNGMKSVRRRKWCWEIISYDSCLHQTIHALFLLAFWDLYDVNLKGVENIRLSYDSWNVYLPHHALFSPAVWDLYDANLKGVVFWPLANSAGDFHRGYFKPRTPARQCYSSLSLFACLALVHCIKKVIQMLFTFKV